jgi:hypothetical protein
VSDDTGPVALATALWVTALLRQVNAGQGFATVLARGEAERGAVLLVHRRAQITVVYERVPDAGAGHVWRQAATGQESVDTFVSRQRGYDRDLWVVELDIADPARFVPGLPVMYAR